MGCIAEHAMIRLSVPRRTLENIGESEGRYVIGAVLNEECRRLAWVTSTSHRHSDCRQHKSRGLIVIVASAPKLCGTQAPMSSRLCQIDEPPRALGCGRAPGRLIGRPSRTTDRLGPSRISAVADYCAVCERRSAQPSPLFHRAWRRLNATRRHSSATWYRHSRGPV
jgi:hypothetical protein